MCFVPVASLVLAYPLYRLQVGRPPLVVPTSLASQLNEWLPGKQLDLPKRDFYGSAIPATTRQVELMTSCASCMAGTSRYALTPTYDRKTPLLLVFNDEKALRAVGLRGTRNVYMLLENTRAYIPTSAWSAAPAELVVSGSGKVVRVLRSSALYVEAISREGGK